MSKRKCHRCRTSVVGMFMNARLGYCADCEAWREAQLDTRAGIVHDGSVLGACGQRLTKDNRTNVLTKVTCKKCREARAIVGKFLGKLTALEAENEVTARPSHRARDRSGTEDTMMSEDEAIERVRREIESKRSKAQRARDRRANASMSRESLEGIAREYEADATALEVLLSLVRRRR